MQYALCHGHGGSQAGLPKPDYPCQLSKGEPCNACKKLEDLESNIADVNAAFKAALSSLIEQHRQIRTEINQSHLNPIVNRIPPEIASSIFEFCLSSYELVPAAPLPIVTLNSAPLVLGAVCRSWREIVWTTPRLWTHIVIFVDVKNLSLRWELVQEWLARSGQLPLSMNISCYTRDPRQQILIEDYEIIFPLIDIVNQHSGRWQNLSLSIPSFLLSRFSGDFHGAPRLKRLEITLDPSWEHVEGEFYLKNAKPSPSEVTMSMMRLKSIGIEWNNATWVDLYSLHADECLELLRLAPLLTQCILDNIDSPANYFPIPGSPIVHNNVQELTFKTYTTHTNIFFDKVLLPALSELTYWNESDDLLPVEALKPFLDRSSCRLEVLNLSTSMLREEDLFALLFGNPFLIQLSLSSCLSGDEDISPYNLFELLGTTSVISRDGPNGDKAEELLLPKLQSFSYLTHPADSLDWKRVLEIFGPLSDFDAQCPRRRPLKNLKISIFRDYTDPYTYIDYPTLLHSESLQDAGINLEFTDEVASANKDLIELSFAHHVAAAEED